VITVATAVALRAMTVLATIALTAFPKVMRLGSELEFDRHLAIVLSPSV
jgi:hypothetical protein